MTKEDLNISDLSYNQWKQHECTKALIKFIRIYSELQQETCLNYIKNSNKLDINFFFQAKGKINAFDLIFEAIQNKKKLEDETNDEVIEELKKIISNK